MLSEQEYENVLYEYNNISSEISGQERQTLRNFLRKKLHEHKLASLYPPFEPLPHTKIFINYTTDDLTLVHLIKSIQCAKNFILDTESINIRYQPNKPALIQIQIILPTSYSYVILVEVCHLPPEHDITFDLIKLLFKTLFQADKTIYIWGEITELINFTQFKLFSSEQIHLSNNQNLQKIFKRYWNDNYQHRSTLYTSNKDSQCNCESCLGIEPNHLWSLQNAIAYKLHLWLDKRFTRSKFHMGLDPNLKQVSTNNIVRRQQITDYASNDVLSIQQLLLKLNYLRQQQPPPDSMEEDTILLLHPYSPVLEQISSNDEDPDPPLEKTNSNIPTEQQQERMLNPEQRRKIHNRSCTLKQRKRYYRHELIFRNIYYRFTIRRIKQILIQHNILFNAVNIATSATDQSRSLFIGIKYKQLVQEYKEKLENFFTIEHYRNIHKSTYDSSDHHGQHRRGAFK